MWHKAPSYLWGCRLQWPCCILALSSNKPPSIASSSFPVTLPGLFSSSHATATFLSALPQPPGSSPISAFLPHASGPLMSPNVPNPVLLTWKRPGGHGLMPTTSHMLHLPSRSHLLLCTPKLSRISHPVPSSSECLQIFLSQIISCSPFKLP